MGVIAGFTALLLDRNSEVAKQRRAICKGCPVSEYGTSRFCKVRLGGCGCVIVAKVRDKSEECPVGRWGKV